MHINTKNLPSINRDECNYIDIARFIGIYFVILDHFPNSTSFLFIKSLISIFHMPLFFMISGILNNNNHNLKFNQYVIRSIKSLLVPYLLYNVLFLILYFPFTEINFYQIVNNFLKGFSFNGPTWFFLVLFYIKIVSRIAKHKFMHILISLSCILLLYYIDNTNGKYANLLDFRTLLSAFPYFALGYIFKALFNRLSDSSKSFHIISFKLLIIILSLAGSYWIAYKYGYMNIMALGYRNHIMLSFIMGALSSISVLFFSSLVYLFTKSNMIKILSRGTMFIVGTHWLITNMFRLYIPDLNVIFSSSFALIILFGYYYPIKHTYQRIPILYGK